MLRLVQESHVEMAGENQWSYRLPSATKTTDAFLVNQSLVKHLSQLISDLITYLNLSLIFKHLIRSYVLFVEERFLQKRRSLFSWLSLNCPAFSLGFPIRASPPLAFTPSTF